MSSSAAAPFGGKASRGIILIGMRGVGKSTIGALVAKQLTCPFFDLDDLALHHLGATSVSSVFELQGETAWRTAEADALKVHFESRARDQRPSILAIGGGAPMNPSCAKLLAWARTDGWKVVLLTAPIDHLVARLQRDRGDRPALTDLPLESELTQLAQERAPTYSMLCDASVDSSGAPKEVAEVVAALRFD